jgi:DNA mismatch endonuclease (patch repair protein)
MADKWDTATRSRTMSRIRSRDTKPELVVRSLLHRQGYRFRLHRKDLPGRPDIVLPRYRTVVFIHGCFWHQHKACPAGHMPKSRQDYWEPKLARNVKRDAKHRRQLRAQGWQVLTVWECQIKRNPKKVLGRLRQALEQQGNT